jgi:hypothetical protein
MKSYRPRTKKGQVSEFGAVFCAMILFVFLPLLNFSFMPVRFLITQGIFCEFSRRLGHCEKFTEAQALMAKDARWLQMLGLCGVNVSNPKLELLVTTGDGSRSAVFTGGNKLPDEWLPGGANSPCIYSIGLKGDCTISALYQGPLQPAVVKVAGHSQWENLSKDPKSIDYFINE